MREEIRESERMPECKEVNRRFLRARDKKNERMRRRAKEEPKREKSGERDREVT